MNAIRKYIDSFPVGERRLAREQLGIACGVGESAVRHWANGTRNIPAKHIPAAAAFMGVAVSELLPPLAGAAA